MSSQGSTLGSSTFKADEFFEQWPNSQVTTVDNFQTAIQTAFGLSKSDNYLYHASPAAVRLPEVQRALGFPELRQWYNVTPPTQADIDAYISIFASATSTAKALTSFEKNAKKDSLRASIATHLAAKREFPPTLSIPKQKAHVNPYFDFWAWSCKSLEWAGPDADAVSIKTSHHVLPIFYHHFGCVCPSFESLEALRQLAKGRPVIDAGSGNGYWSYMLRRMGLTVHAVDNGDSVWRTTWIDDTVKTDAAAYLKGHGGGKDAVLLLVYPQTTGDFTKRVLNAYTGSLVCVAGTQNGNGFTGFKDMTFDEYMASNRPGFEKTVQTPLPSFAGKDDAFYVFSRR